MAIVELDILDLMYYSMLVLSVVTLFCAKYLAL